MVHVDFDTQQRTIKDSGAWYRDLIAASGSRAGLHRLTRSSAGQNRVPLQNPAPSTTRPALAAADSSAKVSNEGSR